MIVNQPKRPTLAEIEAARERIAPYIRHTPLVELPIGMKDRRIFLKLETLQPIGAFKLRPAMSALLYRDREELANGVAVSSSGNMAYGTAWAAQKLGVPMAAYMMSNAPVTKIDGVRKLGGQVRFISGETWWSYITETAAPEGAELLINPVTDAGVIMGNGSIGLEILEDFPEPDWVLTPIGGGIRATNPRVKILAAEGEHAAPATAALAAGKVVEIEAHDSFIKSIGGPSVVPGLWPVVRELIDGTSVARVDLVVHAMRLLFTLSKVVAEGAGAASLAAAIHDARLSGNIVCVISGGNIEADDYVQALQGKVPVAK